MQVAEQDFDYLGRLNRAQRVAAEFGGRDDDGCFTAPPLLIIAGAGTGKTMTLAHRVAHLVVEGVAAERILLLTFTRRAAQEMTRRVENIVHASARDAAPLPSGGLPWSGTFHSIANRLLRRFAHNLGLDPGFSVLDRGDAADMIDVVRHELKLTRASRRFPKKDTCLAIYSRRVNTQKPLAETLDQFYPWCVDWADELGELFRHYVERKQQSQSLDYDDLLLYWKHLVGEPEFAEEIGSWFDHVLVDEYQDTNLVQAEILKALKPRGNGVTVVGDDAQSIYSFRAAEVENILGFPDQFVPTAQVITLEQNYRSTQPVLDAANCLIAQSERQYRKNLFSERRDGARPAYVTVEDGDAEAEFVVEKILANREQGMQLREQAVLFRGSHHSDRLELELVRRNIPYVKYGGLKFLEAAHVKDLLSVLKWAENPKNEVAAFRVLKLLPGMGPSYAARCFAHLALNGHRLGSLAEFRPPAAAAGDWPAFCELLVDLGDTEAATQGWQAQVTQVRHWYQPHLERIYDGIDTREADLEQLEQISGRYPTRERFLTELTLDPPSAAGDLAGDPLLDEDYLVLSTVHSAKGQEWEAVFLLNVTDGSFPSEFATGKPENIEEERRLFYVAMTRARQSLMLVSPLRFHVTQQRRDGDKHVYGARSRFMTEQLLATMDQRFAGRSAQGAGTFRVRSDRTIDVAEKMRQMW
ncbi:MAG: ATP-dependent helicase [Gammaproteobacteria bacterium]|nr:ATP-dependent helicase [Gammaproteobacteria bacterium]NNF49331.1 ATP-dependent helicase [Woeseiaceae bacterium]MBT8094916.1 ATP-dependent helicase [Gammaproteobacteria bacterium]MBT8104516.1 ATP-dependent helicase [Gammaproteobacteria bacterium]NNK24530.1 ATP-dependent helicase [Woeseiaceae bacterium]